MMDITAPNLPKMTKGGMFAEPLDLDQYGAGIYNK